MKLPFRPQKKKYQAATAARRGREADYTEEPNVKLSNAFIVVLILHLVAIGGIYAFTTIKKQPPLDETEAAQPSQPAVAPVSDVAAAAVATPIPDATPAATRAYRVKSGDTIAKIAIANSVSAMQIIDLNDLRDQGGLRVGEDLKLPAATAAAQPEPARTPTPHDSGAVYTVVKGDTPVSIARKLHVGPSDLLRLNNIEDPKKLKIGMKLKIPQKHSAA